MRPPPPSALAAEARAESQVALQYCGSDDASAAPVLRFRHPPKPWWRVAPLPPAPAVGSAPRVVVSVRSARSCLLQTFKGQSVFTYACSRARFASRRLWKIAKTLGTKNNVATVANNRP